MSPCGMRCVGSMAADVSWCFPPAKWLITRRATGERSTRHGERRPRSWRHAQVQRSFRSSLKDETAACFTRPAAFIRSCERHSCRARCGRSEAARSRCESVSRFFEMKSRHCPMATRAPRGCAHGWMHSPPRRSQYRGRDYEIAANIDALRSRLLLDSGSYQVFCAPASDLPAILPEIGRLRELTFRHAGEGTGSARDLDRFDQTYEHLFVWDRSHQEIAGAYRIGATDIVARNGVEGLYTRTLFDYDTRLLDQIGPALELGRAFVQPGYQRDFSPLLLLWKGIARLVAQSGRYSRLFGVVSISDRYNSTSRQLLVKFLQTHRFDADLGRLVRAKNPPAPSPDTPVHATTVTSLADVSSLIRRIEPDGKDIPVLLRQYPQAQCEAAWLHCRSQLWQCDRRARGCGSREGRAQNSRAIHEVGRVLTVT